MQLVPFKMEMDAELKDTIEEEAQRQDVSTDQLVARAVRLYLERQASKRRAVEEALIEAEKGVFISGEAVMAWVNSWGSENELPMPKPDIQK